MMGASFVLSGIARWMATTRVYALGSARKPMTRSISAMAGRMVRMEMMALRTAEGKTDEVFSGGHEIDHEYVDIGAPGGAKTPTRHSGAGDALLRDTAAASAIGHGEGNSEEALSETLRVL